ncbi:zinc finger CCCH domain-containing protein 13-like [Asterias rubens]|uniref:zinc finger CCCH domain-containing protein 13-like n=1 Tax=Asterias rubens TaxID=7604 RepID=UPI001454E443|nr:zinc finger CCCH domain-containing protein 13-like [Asterias rubens]
MAASISRTKVRTVSECSEGTDSSESELLQELRLLTEIYINELNIICDDSGIASEVCVVLHPATADNVEEQYVCLTLDMKLPEQYPDALPEITIRNSRGISDEHLMSLDAKLKQLAEERQGGAMLYELIEVAKESLTNNNTPSCQCVICLHGFTEGDVFTKTPCYHYFHSLCLARYLKHAQESEEKTVCAVCREPVTYDLSQLENAPAPSANHEAYTPDAELRKMQRRFAALYRRQKEKGGIIDLEAESNKFLIDISQTPTLPLNTGITAVTTQPQNLHERNTKTQDVAPRQTEQGQEEAKPPVSRNDAGHNKRSYPDRPRSSNRSNHRPGGRGSAQGRWSRGRGHTRPHSSGNKENFSKPTDAGRRDNRPGQRSMDKGSTEHENTTDQSQISTGENMADQSDRRFDNDSICPAGITVKDHEKHEREEQSKGRNDPHGTENERRNDASADKLDNPVCGSGETRNEGPKSGTRPIEKRRNNYKDKINPDAKATVDPRSTEPTGRKEKPTLIDERRKKADGPDSKLSGDRTADVSVQSASIKTDLRTKGDTSEPRNNAGRRRKAKASEENLGGDCKREQSNDVRSKSRDDRTDIRKERYHTREERRPEHFNQSKDGSHQSQSAGRGNQRRPSHLNQSNDRFQNSDRRGNQSKDSSRGKGRGHPQRSEQLSQSNNVSQSQNKGRGKLRSEYQSPINQSQGTSQSGKGCSSQSNESSHSKGSGGRAKDKTLTDPKYETVGSDSKSKPELFKAKPNDSATSVSTKTAGFETVSDPKKDLGQRSVAPPPGFENVKL